MSQLDDGSRPLLRHILSTVRSLHSQWFTRVSATLSCHSPCLLACDPVCSLSFLAHVSGNLPSPYHSTGLLCSLRQISTRVHFSQAPCCLNHCPFYISLGFAPLARSGGWELNSQLQLWPITVLIPPLFLETVNLRQQRKGWKSSIMAVMMPWTLQLLKGPPERAKYTYGD